MKNVLLQKLQQVIAMYDETCESYPETARQCLENIRLIKHQLQLLEAQ